MREKNDEERIIEEEKYKGWLNNIISQAQAKKFYGTIKISFDNGQVKRVQKEESLRPPK